MVDLKAALDTNLHIQIQSKVCLTVRTQFPTFLCTRKKS